MGKEGMSRSELADMIKVEARNLINSGELDEQIIDSVTRTAHDWDNMPDKERKAKIKAAFKKIGDQRKTGVTYDVPTHPHILRGDGKQNVRDVSKHWAIRAVTGQMGERRPDVPIGYGWLMATTIPFIAASVHANKGIDWAFIAEKSYEYGFHQQAEIIERHMAGDIPKIVKELQAGTLIDGGNLVPSTLAADLIGFLFNANVVRRLGATVLPMPAGSLDIGKIATAVSAGWIGETAAIDASQFTTEKVKLDAKKLRITVITSNDLVRRAAFGISGLIEDQMRSQAANTSDLAALRGDGTEGEPRGILDMTAADNIFDRTQDGATSTLKEIITDLFTAINNVVENNIPMTRGGWAGHSRTKHGIMASTDADGNFTLLMQQLSEGTLLGFPFEATNAIPTDLDTSGDATDDETDLTFGDFAQFIIGESLDMAVDETDQATVTDSAGSPVQLWDTDQRAFRLLHEEDNAVAYDTAFSIIRSVDWGADVVG